MKELFMSNLEMNLELLQNPVFMTAIFVEFSVIVILFLKYKDKADLLAEKLDAWLAKKASKQN